MLQIVTGKFFRPVELYETLHRRVLYTNFGTFHDNIWEIPVGNLRFSNGWGIRTITAEIWERLEAITLQGNKEALISTAGDELIGDVADVLAFSMNIICTPNHDLAKRLIIPAGTVENSHQMRHRQLRRTFDSLVVLRDEDEKTACDLIKKLVSLDRRTYESFIRAIKRCVTATHRVADDVSLAYTLLVAAIESLAGSVEPRAAEWNDYEEVKRQRIDIALGDASVDVARSVRAAILQNEHTALRRRFLDFALSNIGSTFFREEAAECIRPIKASDLPLALNAAYAIRSRTMHQLRELDPETHSMGDAAETAWVNGKTLLTLEGLHRVARHIILEAIRKAEPKEEGPFDYRSALPGIIRAPLHPQYWVWQTDGFIPEHAHRKFEGFLIQLLAVLGDEAGAQLNDMRPLLKLYEETISCGTPDQKLSMIALYLLWHALPDTEYHLETSASFIAENENFLDAPNIANLVRCILTEKPLEWATQDLIDVEASYWENRRRGRGLKLPAELEAGVAITVAERLDDEGRHEEALKAADRAVGALPGVARILEYEVALRARSTVPYTVRGLVLNKISE